EIPAASATSSAVVSSKPRSAKRSKATCATSARVRRRTRARRSSVSAMIETRSGVEPRLPVRRHRALRARHPLPDWMTVGRRERRTFDELTRAVVVEPVLARLEALDHGVAACLSVARRVLGGRVVAAADVTARRAASEVQPPAARGHALLTALAARQDGLV